MTYAEIKNKKLLKCMIGTDRVPEKIDREVPWRNGFEKQIELGFSSFICQNFGIFDDFSKLSAFHFEK